MPRCCSRRLRLKGTQHDAVSQLDALISAGGGPCGAAAIQLAINNDAMLQQRSGCLISSVPACPASAAAISKE